MTRTDKKSQRIRTTEWLLLDGRIVFFFSPFPKFSIIGRKTRYAKKDERVPIQMPTGQKYPARWSVY